MLHPVPPPDAPPNAASAAIGPIADRFESVHRIAVLRGGGLGDLLFSMPAIQSLAAAYPGASITLLGTPLHAAVLDGRPGPPHHVQVLPVVTGVRDGHQDGTAEIGTAEDDAATERFARRMRRRRFDLAVQLHGGGRYSNPFLLRLGARHTVGLRTPDAADLERTMSYVYYQHEMLRALEVVGLAGVAPVMLEPRIDPTAAERHAARRWLDPTADGLLVIHPGATDVRRRWPAEKFAEVAGRILADGAQVIVVGDGGDREVAARIVAESGARDAAHGVHRDRGTRIRSLAGEIPLGELVGLFSHADVVLGNDSGPRHLAAAAGAATVGIYWFGNLVNAGPLGRDRHRVQLSWITQCPVCGRDCTQVGWTSERCEHEVSFVATVEPVAVYADVEELMARSLPRRGR